MVTLAALGPRTRLRSGPSPRTLGHPEETPPLLGRWAGDARSARASTDPRASP